VERHRIAIVIPAFNEAATIETVVRLAASHGRPIVVDDGSCDGCGELAAKARAEVVRHEVNQGYDDALNSGFARASLLGCEYVITMDADGQHNPELLASFIGELDGGADVVVGVRDRRQRIGEVMFSWAGKLYWGISDPLCGMKAYRVSLYQELGHFDSRGSIGTELAIYAVRKGKRIAQVPVLTRERLDTPRFGTRISANMRIFQALWRALCC